MFYRLYEWRLLHLLTNLPKKLCFMISEKEMQSSPEQLYKIVTWCLEISHEVAMKHQDSVEIEGITIHISTHDITRIPSYLPAIRKISELSRLYLHYDDTYEKSGNGIPVAVAIGKSGREEIIDAIRRMAEEKVDPDTITEQTIEEHLMFKHTPDFVIKTGGDHLVDFLIWQSVYSELFFSDLNWQAIRRVDLIRAFRDYQSRMRRFGS